MYEMCFMLCHIFIFTHNMRTIKQLARSFATTHEGTLQGPFGPMVNIKPFPFLKAKTSPPIIHTLAQESSDKLMHLIEHSNDYYMFDNTATYEQTIIFHNGVKAKYLRRFIGTKKHPRNLYQKATNPAQKFHMYRMMQNSVNKGLSRLGYHMFKDGSIDLEGKVPVCGIMPVLIADWKSELPEALFATYLRPDYFVSIPLFHEALLAEDLENGVVYTLFEKEKVLVKGSYGTLMPIPQLFEMFEEFVEAERIVKGGEEAADLWAGTGVLSVMLAVRGVGKVVAVDPNKYSGKALKLNMETFGLTQRTNTSISHLQSSIDLMYPMPQ